MARGRDRVGRARRPRRGRRRRSPTLENGDADDRRRAGRSGARPGRGAARRPAGSASARKRSPCWRRRSKSAKAQKAEAERVLTRLSDLLKRGIAHAGRLRPGRDRAGRRRRAWSARPRPISPSRRLPARPETIKAAENQVKQAQGRARAGAMAAVQAHDRGAFGRPRRRHHPQSRRPRRAVGAGASRCCRTAR